MIRIIPVLFLCSCLSQHSTQLTQDTGPEGFVSAASLKFHVPPCLPHCNQQDKDELIAEGLVENEIVAAIDQAQQSIRFSMYTFSRKPIFLALIRAAERGVLLRGIVDKGQFRTLGNLCGAQGCALPSPFDERQYLDLPIAQRRDFVADQDLYNGGSITEKLAILLYQLENGSGIRRAPGSRRLVHNKFVIVDDELLLSGSGNWSSTAVSINLENTYIVNGRDHIDMAPFLCMFDRVWEGHNSRLGECHTDRVLFSPAVNAQPNIETTIIDTIHSTRSQIDIMMHHLVHPGVITALQEALARGIPIRMIMDDDDCPRYPREVAPLVESGLQIRFMQTTCSLFQLSHNKLGIFDRQILINGSANWSKAGLRKNYENFVRTVDGPQPASTQAFFDSMWQQAQTVEQCRCDLATAACRARYCRGDP